ncbi:MAG: LemA family protein [Treponema sp.]|nr:LemA family protein [Treponema sp.]MBD5408070.1 LemA family protein [Treponema sp.]MDE6244925.1 LemA family protein [Treponemataceae bacterium]MDE7382939.1 LemA family protein [Treponemataceae bacterium]
MYSCVSGTYNSMIELDEQVKQQWAQVENQYQRRYDLIPNLVETVRGYAKHESDVLTQVTEARASVGGMIKIDESILEDEEKMAQFQKIQDSLSGALQRLLSVTENYPELKANQNFLALQDQLEGTENRISIERKRYNETAQEYNTKIRRFPNAFIANMFGFKTKAYFSAAVEAQTAPKVEF